MYNSSWDKLYIYQWVEWDNVYACRRLDEFWAKDDYDRELL